VATGLSSQFHGDTPMNCFSISKVERDARSDSDESLLSSSTSSSGLYLNSDLTDDPDIMKQKS